MTSERPHRTSGGIAAILEQLQLLADSPQLRHRLGYSRLSTTDLPYADSRRPTDPNDRTQRHIADIASYTRDADANYAVGLL